jgi:serine protease AprX
MKNLLLISALFLSFITYAQEDAWVYFKDKPNAQGYFDNPLTMLSQRALDRRTTQNIPLDMLDIPIHQPYVDQVEVVTDVDVFAKSKWMNAVHVRGTQVAILSLNLLPFVDHVFFANRSLNTGGKMAMSKEIQPVNKVLETQINYNYGSSANQIQMLNGHLLHQQNYTGSGKIIAVLDAGFPNVNTAQPFQNLLANNQILGGYDFVGRNANFYTGNNHGTMVLSTMGGFTDNQLVGTAPDASYYLFITEDINNESPLEESLWVEAAEMADSLGVDVINTSLGYFEYDNPDYNYTYADMNGITSFISRGADKAFSRGMIVVVSAGNSGASANPHIGVPGDAINVLTVGAVNSTEVYAAFSSIGPSSDGRIKPDVMAQGQASVLSNTAGNIMTANGTSFSGPIMAGMVASFWQAFPTFTNTQIVQLVKQSADRFANPNAQYGYGIPDFQLALNMGLLSVGENNITQTFVYPNPVNDILTISVPENFRSSTIQFYNSLGQKVLEQNIDHQLQNISLQSLSSGIYYYNIASADKKLNGKIIKN